MAFIYVKRIDFTPTEEEPKTKNKSDKEFSAYKECMVAINLDDVSMIQYVGPKNHSVWHGPLTFSRIYFKSTGESFLVIGKPVDILKNLVAQE